MNLSAASRILSLYLLQLDGAPVSPIGAEQLRQALHVALTTVLAVDNEHRMLADTRQDLMEGRARVAAARIVKKMEKLRCVKN